MSSQTEKIKEFIQELAGFAGKAESALGEIEKDLEGKKNLFTVFSERMLAIRGTAQQLNLPHIAEIAGLGEELAEKAVVTETRAHLRKCVGCMWDALTSVKYMLEHYPAETSGEQEILLNRLNKTLTSMGGARPTASEDEIEKLLNNKQKN